MNSEEKPRVSVEIYGTNYTIRGGADTSVEHIQLVAKQVDEQMRAIAKSNPKLDMPRIAVLSAVNVMDETLQSREQLKKLQQKHELDQQIHSEELIRLREENRVLKQENNMLKEQNAAQEESYQKSVEQLSALQQQLERLEVAYAKKEKELEERLEQEKQKHSSYHEEYLKLKEDYQKLQNEFNEWLKLIEQDSGRGQSAVSNS